MNCGECRDRLLEADPLEIEAALRRRPAGRSADSGGDASAAGWRQHTLVCGSCLALAERTLDAQEELAAGLDLLRSARPLADAVAAASRESARRDRRVRRVSGGAVAAVAAGVLATRLLYPGGGFGTDSIDVVVESRASSVLVPEVEALLDESVVVLQTESEDVVVFWFYQGRGE